MNLDNSSYNTCFLKKKHLRVFNKISHLVRFICKTIIALFFVFALYFFVLTCYEFVVFYKAKDLKIELKPVSLLRTHATCIVYPLTQKDGTKIIVKQFVKGKASWKKRVKTIWKLVHEYRILHSIQELNIAPKVIGRVGFDAFCMEYVPEIAKADLSREEVLLIKNTLLKHIATLHKKGIYHRDIGYKRNNVMIKEDGSVCIIDFGSSITLDPLLNGLIGHYLASKDYVRVLGWAFRMYGDVVSRKELKQVCRFVLRAYPEAKEVQFPQSLLEFRNKLFPSRDRQMLIERIDSYEKEQRRLSLKSVLSNPNGVS